MQNYVNRLELMFAKAWPKSIDSPLVRNGYSLVASAGITSVLGLVYWMIAARMFTPAELGISVGLLSALQTIGQISQLNFGNVLNRFLPVAGRRSASIIAFAYASAAVLALVFSLGTIVAIEYLLPDLAPALQGGLRSTLFVLAVAFWTVFALQDSVLAGLRMGTAVPIENGIYAVVKIALLGIFAGTLYADIGIFLAWVVPLPVIVLFTNLYIFARVIPRRAHPAHDPSESTAQTMLRFFGWDYAGTLAMSLAMGLAPLIVLQTTGTTAVATYHLSWTITYSLYLIGRSMGISLLAEAVTERSKLPNMLADTIVHTFLPMTAGVTFAVVAAPWIMGLFGPVYAEHGTLLLRLMAAACLPWGITTVYLAYARAVGHLLEIAAAQILTVFIFIGLSFPLLAAFGTDGIGVAWLATHSLVCSAVLIAAVMKNGRTETEAFLLRLVTALARFVETVRKMLGRNGAELVDESVTFELLQQAGIAISPGWNTVPMARSKSDVVAVKLVPADSGANPAVFYKSAHTAKGKRTLERLAARLDDLHADPEFAEFAVEIPVILARRNQGDRFGLLESAISGLDGQKLIPGLTLASQALVLQAAASAMARIHALTAQPTRIDREWCERWIVQPAQTLRGASSVAMNARVRNDAIDRLVAEQLDFWMNKDVLLGCGHRDYSLGNIVFDNATPGSGPVGAPRGLSPQVAGIIDWEASVDDAPSCIDTCHLAITSAADMLGEELGHRVRRLLDAPQSIHTCCAWLADTHAADGFPGDWINDSRALRCIVGLAWLQHISVTIQKSERYQHNKVWCTSNINWVLRHYSGKRPGRENP